jgi:hypothetical protein
MKNDPEKQIPVTERTPQAIYPVPALLKLNAKSVILLIIISLETGF